MGNIIVCCAIKSELSWQKRWTSRTRTIDTTGRGGVCDLVVISEFTAAPTVASGLAIRRFELVYFSAGSNINGNIIASGSNLPDDP